MAAMAAWTGVTTLTLAGCGLKGPLYLPQQKKTKTPGVATPGPPAPASPDGPPADSAPPAAAPTSPSAAPAAAPSSQS
jgi:predicted small lipoprotein YifL